MLDRPTRQVSATIAKRLIGEPVVWRAPLLLPGNWNTVEPEAAVSLIERLLVHDSSRRQMPFLAVYPPLQILRRDFDFAHLTLWQIAVDVDFDVGIIDLAEFRGSTGHINFSRLRQPHSNKPNADSADSEQQFGYLFDTIPILPRLEGGVVSNPKTIDPLSLLNKIAEGAMVVSAPRALQATILSISLSRRINGRLWIVDPQDKRSIAAAGRDWPKPDLSRCEPPAIVETPDGFCVTLYVWYGPALWRLGVRIEGSLLRLAEINRLACAPPPPIETMVGPVRFAGFVLPPASVKDP